MVESFCTQITENVFIGSEEMAYDSNFMKVNFVTHVLNLSGALVANIFDEEEAKNPFVQTKKEQWQHKLKNESLPVAYKTLSGIQEHRFDCINNYTEMKRLVHFIEEAVSQHQSCLIVSLKNKCCTVVMAIVYLLFKFNWSVLHSLEYINHKKIDIEITNAIMLRLKLLQE